MLLCGFCSTGARERMMRKTRDYDAELRALSDKAKSIKAKKIQQLGELVTGTGDDALDLDTLDGALLAAVESADAEEREAWRSRGPAFFQGRWRQAVRRAGGNGAGGNPPSAGADPGSTPHAPHRYQRAVRTESRTPPT